jgi:hypothetical protein
MLKYNLQARIGQMAGIMVAYHNTCKIFGFEYVPQVAMDEQLYGSSIMGKACFNISTKLLDVTLNALFENAAFPDAQQIRVLANAPKGQKHIDFFVEAIPEDAYVDHHDELVRAHYAPYGVDLLGVAELKSRLNEMGLDDKGVRPALVARLESALHPPNDADIPSLEFFEAQMQAGLIKHYRLHIYLAQHGNMVDSLHHMTLTNLELNDPQEFAEKNGLQVRYQFEPLLNSDFPMRHSAKKYRLCVREAIDDAENEDRAKVAAEIPLNG